MTTGRSLPAQEVLHKYPPSTKLEGPLWKYRGLYTIPFDLVDLGVPE